jgi:hypothetical protein
VLATAPVQNAKTSVDKPFAQLLSRFSTAFSTNMLKTSAREMLTQQEKPPTVGGF